MHPKVSVIIPTYNSEKFIAKAIESVLQQTYPNVELIVVDDASQDNTVEVVKGYCSDRIKLIVNDRNQGPSYSRNRAIEVANGEWIALLDSDDWFAGDRLEKLLQVAQSKNADFVVDDLYFITEGAEKPWTTRFSERWGFGTGKVPINTITQLNAVDFIELDLGVVKPLIKREFLVRHGLKFDEELRFGEDFHLFLLCLLKGAKFIVVPTPYYFYYSRADSLIHDYIKCQEQMHQTTAKLLQKELIKNQPSLTYSLHKRMENLGQSIKMGKSYKRVVLPLKRGELLTAIAEMLQNPLCLKFYSRQKLIKLNYHFKTILDKKINQKSLNYKEMA